MQVRRLQTKELIVGNTYLAYSAKSKKLSSKTGTFVTITSAAPRGIKMLLLGTENPDEVAITNLDSRDDAWVYDPNGVEIEMRLNSALNKTQWPKWTPRLESSDWMSRTFTLDTGRFYKVERPGEPGNGVTMARMEDPNTNPNTGRPYVTNFPLNWLQPVNPPEWRIPRAERLGLGAVELPLPPKPVKPEHQEALNALVKSGLMAPIMQGCKENTNHMRISGDLKKVDKSLNQVCHRELQRKVDFEAAYLITLGLNTTGRSWVKGRPSDEALELYITYLTGYSPYADVFISKDPKFVLEHGYVIDTNQPNRLVVGACFATRQVWEKPQRAEAFLALLKTGVSLDAAFMFGSQCSVFKDGKMKMSIEPGDHNHFQNKRVSDKCMVNFITHQPEFPGETYSKNVHASGGGTGGVDGMWSKSYSNGSSIYQALSDIKGAGSDPTRNALSVDEVVERSADLIDEWMGRHGLA